ncbi:hypothetical protein R6Q59_021752 [Mikania micrantha]
MSEQVTLLFRFFFNAFNDCQMEENSGVVGIGSFLAVIMCENALLEFGKVLNTKQQVVQGIMYYITLEASDGGEKKTYEAKIWVKPWENFKELQTFKPVDAATSA